MPVEFQWASLGIGITALAVALTAVLRMILGRPRLIAEFEIDTPEQRRNLVVFLKNQSVRGPAKALGVARDTIQSLTASFQISEISRGTIIPVDQALIYSDSDDDTAEGRERVTLPPTYNVAAVIMVARWDINNQRVVVPASRTRTETVLPEGDYEAAILFMVDGQEKTFARRFAVGQGADHLKWSTPR